MFENKKKFALWMYPETYEKIEAIYKEDTVRADQSSLRRLSSSMQAT